MTGQERVQIQNLTEKELILDTTERIFVAFEQRGVMKHVLIEELDIYLTRAKAWAAPSASAKVAQQPQVSPNKAAKPQDLELRSSCNRRDI